MIRLTRQFRFFLRESALPDRSRNNWSGLGVANTFAPFVQLECTVAGEPDRVSGYLCDIKQLDQACRDAVDALASALGRESGFKAEPTVAVWLLLVQANLNNGLPKSVDLARLAARVSPFLTYQWQAELPEMIAVTQQFEFSAAHRLHCPEWSEEQNAKVFGKCNHVHGHGHNYVVEISRRVHDKRERNKLDLATADVDFSWPDWERLVHETVIERLDHKFLNVDVPEFKGLNPSVENIARVIWGWLVDQLPSGDLTNVRVYETPKTWADYVG